MGAATELGRTIGNIANEQSSIQENISADESDAQYVTTNDESFKVNVLLTATKKVYDSTSFIIDHPVQGIIDSPTLEIDGGYLTGSDDILIYSKEF